MKALRLATSTLLLTASAAALAGPPPSMPATYVYQELQPGFRLEATLKSTKPCPENRFPTVLSEEWSKSVSTTTEREGKKVTLRDRNILLRSECDGKRPNMKLTFELSNTSRQYDHVHLTLLDGLTMEAADQVRIKSGH